MSPVSDAQKAASLKWDKENMTTVGCRITRAKANQFKEACKTIGTVPNQVFLKAIEDTINAAIQKSNQ